MINNVKDLQKALKTKELSSLNSTLDIDERLITIGITLSKDDECEDIDFTEKNTLFEGIYLNTKAVFNTSNETIKKQLLFPFSMDDFTELVNSSLKFYLCLSLEKKYGWSSNIPEKSIGFMMNFIKDESFISAIVEKGKEFEYLPESIETCVKTPEYEKGEWLDFYTGYGLTLDDEGVYGVFSVYDQCEWVNDYLNLLSKSESMDFFTGIDDLNGEWNEQLYFEWVIDNNEDPLDIFISKEDLQVEARKNLIALKKDLSFKDVVFLVKKERDIQKALSFEDDTDSFDKTLSANDFISLSLSYLGRAAQKSFRNKREGHVYRDNVIKAIALLSASLETESTVFKN